MIEIQSRGPAIVEPVFVQTADDAEYQLIRTAQEAANSGNWVVGECASKWLAAYAKGRTDEAFGELIGLSGLQVQQRRRVWETFGSTEYRFENLTWTHFREALTWEDAKECLEWADHCAATVKEMSLWRKAKRGELQPGRSVAAETKDADIRSDLYSGIKTRPDTAEQSGVKPASREGRTIHRSIDETRNQRDSKPSADQSKPAQAENRPEVVEPEPEPDPTTVVAMALRKIDELMSFVITSGSEDDRKQLVSQLRTVVSLLDPQEEPRQTRAAKPEKVQAGLAVANAVVNEWNMIDGVIQCRSVTPKRRQMLAVRMKDQFWREHWREAIDKVRSLPCLQGRNDRNWQADLDWFLRPDTVALVIEGKYDNWTSGGVRDGNRNGRTHDDGSVEAQAARLKEIFG